MKFSGLMNSAVADGHALSVDVGEDWLQGRSVFGGLQAALMLAAMRRLVPAALPLRTLQVTFIAPIGAGTLRAQATLLRTGKSAMHVQAVLADPAGATLCLAAAVFGASRESQVRVTPQRPAIPGGTPIDFRYVQGLTPNFTRHYSMRWLLGNVPFSGTPGERAVIEVGVHDDGAASEGHLLGIADVIPPVALSRFRQPVFGSSLTWAIDFLLDRYDTQPLTGWRLDAELVGARDGYTSQDVHVWAPDGQLAALSRQCMVVFG
ncbi:MAG TPA: thioesterase family protein [Nevskiaceae bacterium]|nr:thioesterase family protein [Nevskiaceae bacterium]